VKLTTHLRPVPWLGMSGAIPPFPSVSMVLTIIALSCTYICSSLQQFFLEHYLSMKKQSRCLSVRATVLRISNHFHKLFRVAFIMLASIDYSDIYTTKACSRNNFKNSPHPRKSPDKHHPFVSNVQMMGTHRSRGPLQ